MDLKAIDQAETFEAPLFYQTDKENNGFDTKSVIEGMRTNEDQEALERMLQDDYAAMRLEQRQKRDYTRVYDPGERKENTVSFCEKKYGSEIAESMYQAKMRGEQIDKATYAKIMKISTGKISIAEKDRRKKITANDKNEIDQFIRIKFNLLDNDRFRADFSGKVLTYMLLRRNIIRKKMKQDKLKLYEDYYIKNKLASSIPVYKLGRDMGISPTTVRKYIKELVNSGVIRVDKVKPHEAWDNQPHNIYIFGTHRGKNNEKYFIDEVYSDAE